LTTPLKRGVNETQQIGARTACKILKLGAVLGLCLSAILAPAQNAITNAPSRTIPTSNTPPPIQIITTSTPPLPPSRFNPDAGVLPPSINIARPEAIVRPKWETNSVIPPKPPPLVDPDPGAMLKAASTNVPFFKQEIPLPPGFKAPPVPQGLELPRVNLRSEQLEFIQPSITNYGAEPLPKG